MKKQFNTKTCAIVAIAQNRVIGNKGQLPWHLPADLKHFKAITSGHPIIMGRKTYLSIGRPLPNRKNIIVTRDQTFEAPGCVVVHSTHAAVEEAKNEMCDEIFVIGGAEIYDAMLPEIDKIYLTIVECEAIGDAYFPVLNEDEWRTVAEEKHTADEQNGFAYRFLILERM